jgi:two-component system chemotaxis sensor kinase CheA
VKIDLSRYNDAFLEEAAEHHQRLEQGLLGLESGGAERELLDDIFRAAHSIKGSAATLGFADITALTHALESVLDRVRGGCLDATPGLVALLIRAADELGALLACARSGDPAPGSMADLVRELGEAVEEPAAPAAPEAANATADAPAERDWRVRFTPDATFFASGSDPLLLLRDLAQLGAVDRVALDLSRLPSLEGLDPETCHLAWSLRLRTAAGEAEIREVFSFAEESCALAIEAEAPVAVAAAEPVPVERRQGDRREGDRREGDRRQGPAESSSIRVPTDRVDHLINLVGELIIAQSMVSQIAGSFSIEKLPALLEAIAATERNTRDLQERVLSIRMVPASAVFNRFPRLVRDLSAASGKLIRLELSGEDTDLDKAVIEGLGDPLTHLVRNAADHGLESPEERADTGKPGEGVIRLSARHVGGAVIIELSDDGRGLDTARIRAKAVERGLVRADEALTDEQLHALIFQPGFSTAAVVSDLSGRGVGMDVVKRNLEALNGSIAIETAPGRGTRFRIRLPLTLAVLDGMALDVGGRVFILPLLAIVESLRPKASEVRTIMGAGEVVMVRGEAIPLLRLHRVLRVPAAVTAPERALVVIAESDGRRVGLLVDQLLGQSQVVIKNLETHFRRVEGVMGATITGEGRVALILDLQGLVRLGALAPSVAAVAA